MENNATTATTVDDIWGVITESKRIINTHSRHFLALSVLFLLPLSFSLSVFPTLFYTFTSPAPNHTQSLLFFTSFLPHNNTKLHLYPSLFHPSKTLSFYILFSSFTLFFSLLAFSSVASSVFHGFYGRPVKLRSAFTSLFKSFLRLLATLCAALVVILVVFAVFVGFFVLGLLAFQLFRPVDADSPYFSGVLYVLFLGYTWLVGYLIVNWAVAGVVVVVEGKWGFEALLRSKGLMRGMRCVAVALMVFFGFFVGALWWISMMSGVEDGAVASGWNTWAFGVRIVASSAVLTLVLLHSIAANTVLYMYSKALHGELAGEIVHEFASDYVSLPFDDQKVPHVVCFVR